MEMWDRCSATGCTTEEEAWLGSARSSSGKKKETWKKCQLLVLFLVKNIFLVTLSCHVLLLLIAKLVNAF